MQTSPRLIDNQQRSSLAEGRQYGMGFAFCKLEGEVLTTVGPLSTCKDFLNDQVYSENTGKDYRRWGYCATKTKCFDGAAHLIISVLAYKGGTTYAHLERDKAALEKNWLMIQSGINWLEQELHQEGRTQIKPLGEGIFWVKAPTFWVESTYMISLLSLTLRYLLHYDGKTLPEDFLSKPSENMEDTEYMKTAMTKIKIMSKKGLPKQDFSVSIDYHNEGIMRLKV